MNEAGLSGLARLAGEISACRFCRDIAPENALPHEPRPIFRLSETARIFICSQAPGVRAHISGIPFDDPSGVRLRAWMGVSQEEFYDPSRVAIVPMGFCFPGHDKHGGDLPPRRECAKLWRERVFQSLPQQSSLMLLIGAHAQKWHLGELIRARSLTEVMKDWRRLAELRSGTRYLPLPHPSWRNSGWLRKNPWFEADVIPYLRYEVRTALEG